ncbi:MAG: helix-turn-helix transcriptional regulator [bacterium]|nr:helix-turn-helix transcriptional regulator [bacterium]
MALYKTLGEKIKKYRKEKGLTQEQLADAAEIERSYMGTIERGERNPTLLKVYKIAKALTVNLSELLNF